MGMSSLIAKDQYIIIMLSVLLFAGTKFSEISDFPNFR